MKQGLRIMSRASLKFPFCSAFVPWLHGRVFDGKTEFWKAVILIFNTCFFNMHGSAFGTRPMVSLMLD